MIETKGVAIFTSIIIKFIKLTLDNLYISVFFLSAGTFDFLIVLLTLIPFAMQLVLSGVFSVSSWKGQVRN